MEPGVDPTMADLAARIDQFERSHAPKRSPKAEVRKASAPAVSPLAKAVRRWWRAACLAWGLIIYLLIAVGRSGQASVWELIFGFVFAIVVSLACYAISLFQWELGKGVWGLLRRLTSRDRADRRP